MHFITNAHFIPMPKTILIPTNLKVSSLYTLKVALEDYKEKEVEIILLYADVLENSITELLFFSPRKRIEELMSDEFRTAIEIIKNRFEPNLTTLSIQLFQGKNQASFVNFLEAKCVDEIYTHLKPNFPSGTPCANLHYFIDRVTIPVKKVDHHNNDLLSEGDHLQSLFA